MNRLSDTYEPQRDLLTGMAYQRGDTLVAQREYAYDALSRPTSRNTARQEDAQNDSFTYNPRSELINATVSAKLHGYDYDNIGNRRNAIQGQDYAIYAANPLNQYTEITGEERGSAYRFVPQCDDAGNQTLIRTGTGIWSIEYNAENRPVSFNKEEDDGTVTRITCTYDSKGRRATKKVESISTEPGTGERETVTILHQRYLYRGYLQIAACDLTSEDTPSLWHILWDPTQHVATRPLAIQQDDTWYCYGWDLTKNICELFQSNGTIGAAYAYAPFGEVAAEGDVTQPFQWSSEYHDTELGMVYYNYRYYNPTDGRWSKRDPMEGRRSLGLYGYCENNPINRNDILGLYSNQSSAARAAIKKWVELSIKNDIEYCGLICKKKGTSEYTYTEASGDIESCFPHNAPCPSCYVEVAFWHTHGAFIDEDGDGKDDRGYDTENFSGSPERGAPGDDNYGDLNYAQDYDIDSYLGTPKGSVKMYDHNGNAVYNKKRWK